MDSKLTLYPLTAAQSSFYSVLEACPHKQILNIGASLTLKLDIDFDILKESIIEAYQHCEFLRVRFTKDKHGQVMQYVVPEEEYDISFFEFSHWKEEDAENEMKKWSKVPFDRFDVPMSKMTMISMPGGFNGMYMLADHMIIDAQALFLFFKDVIEIYCSKKYNMNYPKPLKSFVQALEKDIKYYGSKAYQRDETFWTDMIKESEPIYTDILGDNLLEQERKALNNPNLRAVVSNNGSYESDVVSFHLEPNPSDVLINFCIENNLSMACLLLMSLRTYLQKINNNEPDISIDNAVARRATLLEKLSGGTRVQFFPCRTVIHDNETFINGCRKIQENQNQVFRHTNFPRPEINKIRSKVYNLNPQQVYEPISLTYQPLTLKNTDVPDIDYKCSWYSNGVAAENIYLTVTHGSLDNGLDFIFEYRKEKFDFDKLEKIYYFITRILFEGVLHPNETIAEVISNT